MTISKCDRFDSSRKKNVWGIVENLVRDATLAIWQRASSSDVFQTEGKQWLSGDVGKGDVGEGVWRLSVRTGTRIDSNLFATPKPHYMLTVTCTYDHG